jgi:hypothetical protein
MSDISRLIADVKEQVLYLQELGGDALEFDPKRIEVPKVKVQSPRSSESIKGPAPTVVKEPAARKSLQKESRLGSLPSLSKRAPVEPSSSISRAQTTQIEMNENTLTHQPDEVSLIDIAPRLDETSETIESIRADIGTALAKLHSFGRKQIVNDWKFQADLMSLGKRAR